MEWIQQLKQDLQKYMAGKPEISMCFLFGSYSEGQETLESDLDIAVYFQPAGSSVEWEEVKEYPGEEALWADFEKISSKNVDLVVLNRAAVTLAANILQEGIPVLIRNKKLYWNFLLHVSSEAEAFRRLIEDFWRIKQRSGSLSEVDRERLIRIADFMAEELKEYETFKSITRESFESESALRRNVERWVENIVNCSVDIAKILLASAKKKIPHTDREVLDNLSQLKGFSKERAAHLSRFIKLRNILAHEYLDLRFRRIKEFIQESEEGYSFLLEFITRKLRTDDIGD